jgi:NAD(P)-dependent dehydrogenase (short-subunit alcohol dehydrogenase family)
MTFLHGKVVVITGVGRGLGAAYAMADAEAGAAVMVRLGSWVRRWGALRRGGAPGTSRT